MNSIYTQVYEEDDYTKFKRLDNNRTLTEQRLQKLIASISSGEILNPIIVNEKMEIIDGQGRYEAKKRLGLPIQYVISRGAGIEDCQKMNRYNTKWSLVDYIYSYARSGNKNYIRFSEIMEQIKCAPTKTATFANMNGGVITDVVESGKLIFTEDDAYYTLENYGKFTDILDALLYKGRINQNFILAAIIIFNYPGYQHKKMIEQCKKYRNTFVQTARRKDQVVELQRIYNINAKKKIYFEDYFRNLNTTNENKKLFDWERKEDISTLKSNSQKEKEELKEQIKTLQDENSKMAEKIGQLTAHNARGAGRKKHDEKYMKDYQTFCELAGANNSMDMIMQSMNISRSTYFRFLGQYRKERLN